MTGTYLTEDQSREELKNDISLTNQEQQKWVINGTSQSNRQVENDLSDAFETFPADNSDPNFSSFADAALMFLKYLWALRLGKQNAKDYKTAYDAMISGLKTQAKSQVKTNRRPAMLSAYDVRNSKIPLPCQTGIFAFDNFA